jgi:hypothetical protein
MIASSTLGMRPGQSREFAGRAVQITASAPLSSSLGADSCDCRYPISADGEWFESSPRRWPGRPHRCAMPLELHLKSRLTGAQEVDRSGPDSCTAKLMISLSECRASANGISGPPSRHSLSTRNPCKLHSNDPHATHTIFIAGSTVVVWRIYRMPWDPTKQQEAVRQFPRVRTVHIYPPISPALRASH